MVSSQVKVGRVKATVRTPDNSLAAGDVVQLKSGGPPMTVTGWNQGSVSCRWFHDGRVESDNFPEAALKRG